MKNIKNVGNIFDPVRAYCSFILLFCIFMSLKWWAWRILMLCWMTLTALTNATKMMSCHASSSFNLYMAKSPIFKTFICHSFSLSIHSFELVPFSSVYMIYMYGRMCYKWLTKAILANSYNAWRVLSRTILQWAKIVESLVL